MPVVLLRRPSHVKTASSERNGSTENRAAEGSSAAKRRPKTTVKTEKKNKLTSYNMKRHPSRRTGPPFGVCCDPDTCMGAPESSAAAVEAVVVIF